MAIEPTIQVPNQLVGSPLGSDLALSCKVEAYPKPITFWRKNNEIMILDGPKYKVLESHHSYHTNMTLVIRDLQMADIGTYTCMARNSINQAEGQIRTYKIDPPATHRPTTDKGPRGGTPSPPLMIIVPKPQVYTRTEPKTATRTRSRWTPRTRPTAKASSRTCSCTSRRTLVTGGRNLENQTGVLRLR
ncbi:hypothetical protein C7M84_012755 [Penaeus vannamei]|uniref:Ig-like domain-containing protein n=1 Tax=Penaeus vannamei TaxID=6689 RepID=A0A423SYI7_PENVA|nr:hypothetical protein C7M84_012755 [Penaeus vannamei]